MTVNTLLPPYDSPVDFSIRIDTDKNPMGLLDGFRGRENFTAYFINKEQVGEH